MMTNKNLPKIFVFFLFFSVFLPAIFGAENAKWTIAAQKFDFAKGQSDSSINRALSETIPVSILEKLNKNLERNVLPDEIYSRKSKELLKSRQSLFLQLSSAYQKRDALFLENISQKALEKKIKEEEKNIREIQKKIDDNLQEQNELILKTENQISQIDNEDLSINKNSEFELYKKLFKNIFHKEESIIQKEQIVFYQNDFSVFYQPSEKTKNSSPLSKEFAEEIYSKNINTLLTGIISKYEDYLSVKVEVILYPNAKVIGSFLEIGSIDDLEFIASSLANQIVPSLTNSMPVKVNVKINPEELQNNTKIYIDDVLFKSSESFILESGVHNIQFVAENFQTVGTDYYFEGNTQYLIEVNLKEKQDGQITLALVKPVFGDIFANGQGVEKETNRKSRILINGNEILGQFLSEDGETAFFYIPQKQLTENNFVSINPKPFDREKYIDSRRKWMYGSYSLLIVSLIPTFISLGDFQNVVELYQTGKMSYVDAKKVQDRTNICSAISIGCGVFFVFELIRYFYAANSVLPQKVKNVPETKQAVFDQPFEEPLPKETESQNEQNGQKQNLTENVDETEVDVESETAAENENKTEIEIDVEAGVESGTENESETDVGEKKSVIVKKNENRKR